MTLSPKDLELRKGRITGTTLGQIVGMSKYGGPIDAYRYIVDGVSNVDPECEDIKRGYFLEPSLRAWGRNKTGLDIVSAVNRDGVSTRIHRVHNFLAVTPDSYVLDDTGRYVEANEIKAPRYGGEWGEDGSDQIPDHHVPQVALQMAVTNLPSVLVFALVYMELRVYRIMRDMELEEALIGAAEKFYRNHIEPKVPPPPDDSKSYGDYLYSRYPLSSQRVLTANTHQEDLLRLYFDARAKSDRAKKTEQAMRNLLQKEIKDNKGLKGECGSATWSTVKGKRAVDYKTIAEELLPLHLPARNDIIEANTRIGNPHRSFRPKPAKDLEELSSIDAKHLADTTKGTT